MTDPDKQWEDYKRIMGKVWRDPDFKAALLKNPVDTLQKEGFDLPEGVKVEVKEDTDDKKHFVILAPPKDSGFGTRPFC